MLQVWEFLNKSGAPNKDPKQSDHLDKDLKTDPAIHRESPISIAETYVMPDSLWFDFIIANVGVFADPASLVVERRLSSTVLFCKCGRLPEAVIKETRYRKIYKRLS